LERVADLYLAKHHRAKSTHRVFDGKGNILLDAQVSFGDIVTRYLVRHMRDHAQQIELVEARHASHHPSMMQPEALRARLSGGLLRV
jgi:hypothetical protein